VSALHRNAHIWNASHPLLVTYYCWVTVYSPGMEAKKIKNKVHNRRDSNPRLVRNQTQVSAVYAIQTGVPHGSYHVDVWIPIYLNFTSQLFSEDRKIRLTPKISNHLFTCYLNCTCKSNPVCLIQQWSVIILLASYVQWLHFLVWHGKIDPLTFSNLCSLSACMQLSVSIHQKNE